MKRGKNIKKKIQVPHLVMNAKSGEIFLAYDVFERVMPKGYEDAYFKFVGLLIQNQKDECKVIRFSQVLNLFYIGHFGEGGI